VARHLPHLRRPSYGQLLGEAAESSISRYICNYYLRWLQIFANCFYATPQFANTRSSPLNAWSSWWELK